MHKTCTKCATSKPLDMFSKQAKGRYGVTSICKACSSARGLAWHAENRERSIALKKAYRDLHKDEIRARSAAWRINNAARARATAAAWAAANKGKKAAAVAKRRAAKAKATPSWADLDLMQNMYRWAAEATAATGITEQARAELAKTSEAGAKPKLIGWRTDDYLMETADKAMAENWSVHYQMLPIFEGDPHTKLAPSPQPAAERVAGWLPIETAPEDTYVCCSGFIGNDPSRGRWVARACVNGGVWFDDEGAELYPPTHYQPLPPTDGIGQQAKGRDSAAIAQQRGSGEGGAA